MTAEMDDFEAEVRRYVGEGHEQFTPEKIAKIHRELPMWPARSVALLLVDQARA